MCPKPLSTNKSVAKPDLPTKAIFPKSLIEGLSPKPVKKPNEVIESPVLAINSYKFDIKNTPNCGNRTAQYKST
ncbi:MAG: hypothetical protein Kow0049_30120 [Stanieria sp.]